MLHRRHLMLGVALMTTGLTGGMSRILAAERGAITRSDGEWRELLTPVQYAVLRQGETEEPYSSSLTGEKRRGIFSCAGCGSALFPSRTKYDSRTGWPSFWQPLEGAVRTTRDRTQGLIRTKIDCRHCGSHIGHVFGDGPPPTYLRYCVNGAGLAFKPV